MRSKFLMLATASMVLGTAGIVSAQNTNTNTNSNTNTNTNSNTNTNTNSNSNRANTNSNRNDNRNTNRGNSNTNTNRGNTNTNNGNSNTNSNNDNSNMQSVNSTSNSSGRATAGAGVTLTALDNKFAMDAAYSNNAEIASGRQALQKSSNPEVQRFAQMMIDHHTQANADLARMSPGVTLPTGLDPHHQAVADGHEKLSGMDFDMAYIKSQLAAHAMTLDMVDTYRDNGSNKELKSYAKKSEPIVKQHLSMVKAMDTRMATGMATPNAKVDQ